MNVCDNLGDHLVGNVYVKFRYEEDAEKAVKDLDNRWYNGKEYTHSIVAYLICYFKQVFQCKKVPSSHLGQVDCPVGQITLPAYVPNWQGPGKQSTD